MSKSTFIAELPDAEFEELDSRPLSGAGLGDSTPIFNAISKMGDTLFPNKRGQTFTLALTAGGLAPASLNAYYWRNDDVLDGYFNRIDMEALGNAIGPGVDQSVKDGFSIPALLTGAAAGFILSKIISR